MLIVPRIFYSRAASQIILAVIQRMSLRLERPGYKDGWNTQIAFFVRFDFRTIGFRIKHQDKLNPSTYDN